MTDRLQVGLIPKAEHSLIELVERTGLSRADVVNKALQIYRFVLRAQSQGDRLVVVSKDGTEQWVEFL